KYVVLKNRIQPGTFFLRIKNVIIFLNPHPEIQALGLFVTSYQATEISSTLELNTYPDLRVECTHNFIFNTNTKYLALRFPKLESTAEGLFDYLTNLHP